MRTRANNTRRGAAAVETAILLPLVCLLTIGLIAGGIGVFRYIQVACLSREGARWASTRGGGYQRDTDQPSPTRQQVIDQAVLPFAAGIDPALLDVQVEWIDRATGTAHDWDAAGKDVATANAAGQLVTNSVRVTVTCRWTLGVFGDVATFQSACEVPMSN